MARRRSAPSGALPLFDKVAAPGLKLHALAERLAALLQQRESLLVEVKRKQAELATARRRAEVAAQELFVSMSPVVGKFDALRGEIAAIFAELLAPGCLSARTRKKVADVHWSLVEQGLSSPLARDPADGGAVDAEDDDAFDERDFEPPPFSGARSGPEQEARVASAPQPGQSPGRESLRALFKRLALLVHPDRAQHEGELERRTEAMKEATRAYQDGDLARLIELENAWQTGRASAAGDDETARRCAELEQTLRELTRQSRALTAELRELRSQIREDMLDVPADRIVADAELELEELARVRDFVRSFRDGKITLARFLEGPDLDPEGEAELAELQQLLGEMLQAQGMQRRGSGKSRKRKA